MKNKYNLEGEEHVFLLCVFVAYTRETHIITKYIDRISLILPFNQKAKADIEGYSSPFNQSYIVIKMEINN